MAQKSPHLNLTISDFGAAGNRKPSEKADHLRDETRRPNQKERILELQRRRTSGTWVQCCHIDCGKWRYLDHVKDPAEIPLVWHCNMNSDAKFGWCSAPQQHIANSAFPRLVQVRFTVGSVVWAHLDGFPWWPAVVDDDPDIEDFYWLDGFSEIPTHYHVTFLDGPQHEVTRAWVGPAQVRKFQPSDDVKTYGKTKSRGREYGGRLAAAVQVAREALSRSLEERRRRYTFAARYRGPWAVYSDSDAETGRLIDGRRPVRRKKRDRRTKRPRPDKFPAAPRRRAEASSRSGSVSSCCSRDSQTVNSLMDVVDDIVSQLTQSQSQSQSQSRRGGAATADEAMFTDTSGSVSDVESGDLPPARRGARSEYSRAEDADEAVQAPGVGPRDDGDNTTKKGAVKATGTDSAPRLKSKPKNTGGDSQTVRPASKPKKTKAPTPKPKKLSALTPPAEKPSFVPKKKTIKNVRAAESKCSSQETPEHVRTGALTGREVDKSEGSDASALDAASASCPPAVLAKPKKTKKPFSVRSSSQPSAAPLQDVESDSRASGAAAEAPPRENAAEAPEPAQPAEEDDAPSAIAEDVSRDINDNWAEGLDGGRSPVKDPRLPMDCSSGSDAEEGGAALLSAAAGEGSPDLVLPPSPATQTEPLGTPTTEPSALFEPAPPTPSPRSYTEQQSEFASKDATAQSQEMFDIGEEATGGDGDAGEDSDPFEADD